MFSLEEIVDLAVQIEKNGEASYRQLLEQTSDPALADLLGWLAHEEILHGEWFSDFKSKAAGSVQDPRVVEMGRSILRGILGNQSFSLEDPDPSRFRTVEDLLKLSIEFQKDTVLFYGMISSLVSDPETKDHLDAIIAEETRHVEVLQEFLDTGKVVLEHKKGDPISGP
jgi:rubrerythrin